MPVLLSACSSGPRGAGGFKMPPVPVEVSEVRAQIVRDAFRAVGTLEAEDDVTLSSENAGVVRSLSFAEGQPVKKGQVVARLDDRELKAEADRAEAERKQAATNFDRSRRLAEQQAISPQELDNASSALQVAEANASLAHVRLDKTAIRAPFDGVIGRRQTSPGAWLKAGDPIAQLARLSPLRVSFAAPERMLSGLRPGRAVEVRTPAWPDRVFEAKLSVVDPVVDVHTRTVQLLASVPNPAGLLRPGLSADVSVTLAERPKSITIPEEAVFSEGGGSFVFVVRPDSSVTKATVTLGARDSSRVEVLRGLEAGQTVVRTGHQKLFDGAHVMPISDVAALMGAGPGGGAPAPKAAPAQDKSSDSTAHKSGAGQGASRSHR
jgi:membrane fusion protein (multidrug efflux system)